VVYEIVLDGERVWLTSDLFEAIHAHRWVNLPWTGALDFDRAKYIQSLARLLKLPPCDHLLPGHGPAAIGGGRRLLEMAYTEALLKWR
jgi:glyoxylase-like metal-dependent hydrolase (beta-lactamase superfamily II)